MDLYDIVNRFIIVERASDIERAPASSNVFILFFFVW